MKCRGAAEWRSVKEILFSAQMRRKVRKERLWRNEEIQNSTKRVQKNHNKQPHDSVVSLNGSIAKQMHEAKNPKGK